MPIIQTYSKFWIFTKINYNCAQQPNISNTIMKQKKKLISSIWNVLTNETSKHWNCLSCLIISKQNKQTRFTKIKTRNHSHEDTIF